MEVNKIYNGDALSLLKTFPDESINCVVSSPPYWGHRCYRTQPLIFGGKEKCEHKWIVEEWAKEKLSIKGVDNYSEFADYNDRATYTNYCLECGAFKGDLGLEPTPEMFVDHLVDIFSEIKRVLKDDGVIWLNLGDTYYSGGGSSRHKGYADPKYPEGRDGSFEELQTKHHKFLKPKDMCGIPFRVAFALQERLGLYLRQAIIWHKLNAMPSSVSDRPSSDYEFVFLLSKSERYYYDADAVREPHKIDSIKRACRARTSEKLKVGEYSISCTGKNVGYMGMEEKLKNGELRMVHPNGRNCRAVWSITTKPSHEQHYAAFPEELPERCIKAGSKEGDIILDPFFGTGTTGLVALKLNRNFVGIDLKKEYCDIAEKRLRPWIEQKRLN